MNDHTQTYIQELEQMQVLLQKQIYLLRQRHIQLLQDQQRILEYQKEIHDRQQHLTRVRYYGMGSKEDEKYPPFSKALLS